MLGGAYDAEWLIAGMSIPGGTDGATEEVFASIGGNSSKIVGVYAPEAAAYG